MRTETVTIYQYDELPTEKAKEKARDWFRSCALDHGWWDSVYEDANEIAELMGITINLRSSAHLKWPKDELCIWFSGFSSQGDGACFEGSYQYAKGSVKAVKAYAPMDTRLHDIVEGLYILQKSCRYKLTATVEHSGHYYHPGCTNIDVEGADQWTEIAEGVKTFLRDFMNWIYRQLNAEHDHQLEDETVIENIQANEYEFEVNGSRYI